jgi:diketogulonate reductase-like aldo/keto reductase
MHSKEAKDGTTLPVIGLGTWTFGGGLSPDNAADEEAVSAIRSAVELGYRHIDTAEMYGAGHAEELVGRALQGCKRSDFFITSKVSPGHLSYREVKKSFAKSLERLGMEYLDLYLIHHPGSVPLEETFKALNELKTEGKTRHLG